LLDQAPPITAVAKFAVNQKNQPLLVEQVSASAKSGGVPTAESDLDSALLARLDS